MESIVCTAEYGLGFSSASPFFKNLSESLWYQTFLIRPFPHVSGVTVMPLDLWLSPLDAGSEFGKLRGDVANEAGWSSLFSIESGSGIPQTAREPAGGFVCFDCHFPSIQLVLEQLHIL